MKKNVFLGAVSSTSVANDLSAVQALLFYGAEPLRVGPSHLCFSKPSS